MLISSSSKSEFNKGGDDSTWDSYLNDHFPGNFVGVSWQNLGPVPKVTNSKGLRVKGTTKTLLWYNDQTKLNTTCVLSHA